MRFLIGLAALLILVAGCSPTAAPPKATTIRCHTAYRSGETVPIEREDSLVFAGEDATRQLAYADLTFHAEYRTGAADYERALRLWVTPAGDEEQLLSVLYQLSPDSGPQNQFDGFTGLSYAYHPTSRAELQFWCETDQAKGR
jgi:hypothetical protein